MPPMPAAPGVLQLVLHHTSTHLTHDLINRVHYHYTGAAPTAAQLVTMAPTLLVEWASVFVPLMPAGVQVAGIDILDLSSSTGAQTALSASTPGTRAGTTLPADTCVVVAGQIARRYRGGHPRTYLPLGVAEDLAGPRTWSGALVTAAVAAMTSFMGVTTGAGWAGAGVITPCNVSYFLGNHLVTYPSGRHRDVPTLRPGGPVVDTITSYVGRLGVGTQRRRIAA
jgi:hypothetical protein